MRIPALRNLVLALLAAPFSSSLPVIAQTTPSLVQSDRVPDHPDLGPKLQLKDILPGWVTPSRDAGSLADSQMIGITVVVARAPQVQAAFEKLLVDQQNPKSALYHRWLTPEQIGSQFGPTQHDLDALTHWLTSQGLNVTSVGPSRILVKASGPSAIVAKAFNTGFRMFTVHGEIHYSAATEPSIPVALSPLVKTISGLVQIPIHSMHESKPARLPSRGNAASPMYTGTDNGTVFHYVFPADFATIFDINPLYAANINGAGQKVAVIGRSDIVNTDITEFETLSGLPANIPHTIVASTGVDPGIRSGDEGESDLDLQRVIGVAPGVTADFVISGDTATDGGLDIAINYEVDTLKDPVMNISYGGCEVEAGMDADQYYEAIFGNAAAEGISVLVSSGDSGAAGCDTHGAAPPATQQLSINFICANPYSTCVGGTQFNDSANGGSSYWSSTNNPTNYESALGYIPEGAWNESTSTDVGASGGGFSLYAAKPSFQVGIGVPADGFRDLPDVSFPASLSDDGYFGCEADAFANSGGDCSKGGGIIFGGTSAAAPGWAGVVALLNQKLGSSQGSLNPLIYRLANLSSGNPFHDVTPITAGVNPCVLTQPNLCNNSTASPSALTGGLQGYGVTTGYDLVTGWGSIDVNQFVTAAVTSAGLTNTTTSLTANPTSITTAQTVVFTASVSAASGTPDGTVQFSSNGAALGSAVALVNGVATSPAETFATIGTYTITASYSGSNTFSDSAATPLLLTVIATGKTASTTTLTATTTAGTPSTPIGFSVTVTGTGGTPTGTVQFQINGTNDGTPVPLAGGTASLPAADLAAGSDVVTAIYSGDNNFSASTSNAVTVTVTAPGSSTSIALSATTTDPTGYLVFSGSVAGPTGGPTPSGSLTLNLVGSGPFLNAPVNLVNGSVAVAVQGSGQGFATGSYTVYWTYSGDANYAASNSSDVTFTVDAGFVPTYTLTPSITAVSSTAGSAATNTITVASANGFFGTIGLACSATFNGTSADTVILPTCSFSPASTSFPDNNATVAPSGVDDAVTLTLETVVPAGTKRAANTSAIAFGATLFAGLFLFMVPTVRRRRTWNALACFLLLAGAAGVSGCGSGGSSGGHTLTGTPSGNYTITVTGTSTGATNVTTTFTLTVQ